MILVWIQAENHWFSGKKLDSESRDSETWSLSLCHSLKQSTRFFGPKFLFLKIYFNWRLITLQDCIGFAIHWNESTTGVHVSPILSPIPNSLPHPIPLGCPSTPAMSVLFHALNLDWWSNSHTIIHMFQRYFLKSSHPRLLPQSLKVCSLHLCLFCCLTYRVFITIFLKFIYMC